MRSYALFLGLLMLSMVSSFGVENLQHQFEPTNEQDYVDYVQFLLGVNKQQNLENLSSKLQTLLKKERFSLLNAVKELQVLLEPSEEHQFNPEALLNLTNMIKLVSKDQADSAPVKTHKIKASPEQISLIKQMFASNPTRLLEEASQSEKDTQVDSEEQNGQKVNEGEQGQGQGSSTSATTETTTAPVVSASYIAKFFFSLMFILVTLVLFGTIANMDNGKDTLLYAKFIADVGR